MPLMSGWEFLEAISIRPYAESIFVIIVSSSVDSCDHKKGEQFSRLLVIWKNPSMPMSSMTLDCQISLFNSD